MKNNMLTDNRMFETNFTPGINLEKYAFLVTGGAGFIGSNIVSYLLKYNAGKVRVLDNLSTGFYKNIEAFSNNPNFEFIKGDIYNSEDCREACSGINYVIHQAALGSVPRSIENPIATTNTNVSGFVNIIVAAKNEGIKRIVYASSSSVYGDSKKLPKQENQIGSQLSPYAVSKYANEIYAGVFAQIYNMELIGLRYFNVFGPNQSPDGQYAAVIPLFINNILRNNPSVIHGNGEQTRDFTYVENAVQANIISLFTTNPDAINQVYNIAVGERISINTLFLYLQENLDVVSKSIYQPERPGDIKDSLADISKAQKLLQYSPEIKVKDGLDQTISWFKGMFATIDA